jgi:hypothetical protein
VRRHWTCATRTVDRRARDGRARGEGSLTGPLDRLAEARPPRPTVVDAVADAAGTCVHGRTAQRAARRLADKIVARDYRDGIGSLPATDPQFDLPMGAALVRPSGTEPKVRLLRGRRRAASRPGSAEAPGRARTAFQEVAVRCPGDRQLVSTVRPWPELAGRGVSVTPSTGMLEARAASCERSIGRPSKPAALELAIRCVDLTTLEGTDTPGKVRARRQSRRPDPLDPGVPSVANAVRVPDARQRGRLRRWPGRASRWRAWRRSRRECRTSTCVSPRSDAVADSADE